MTEQLYAAFRAEVAAKLNFLETQGFRAHRPRGDDSRVEQTFISPVLALVIALYPGREAQLATTVWSEDRSIRADLKCLYVKAALGPPQALGARPASAHALAKAVLQVADALQALLPLLSDPHQRHALLRQCAKAPGPARSRPPDYNDTD